MKTDNEMTNLTSAEQRRYEVAMAVLAGMWANTTLCQELNHYPTLASGAVEQADALLDALGRVHSPTEAFTKMQAEVVGEKRVQSVVSMAEIRGRVEVELRGVGLASTHGGVNHHIIMESVSRIMAMIQAQKPVKDPVEIVEDLRESIRLGYVNAGLSHFHDVGDRDKAKNCVIWALDAVVHELKRNQP